MNNNLKTTNDFSCFDYKVAVKDENTSRYNVYKVLSLWATEDSCECLIATADGYKSIEVFADSADVILLKALGTDYNKNTIYEGDILLEMSAPAGASVQELEEFKHVAEDLPGLLGVGYLIVGNRYDGVIVVDDF